MDLEQVSHTGLSQLQGDFIAQGLFNVKPLPEQAISDFVPIVADPAVLANRGFGPALIGLQQTAEYVEAWSIAISESIPDILGGDYRRVKELQAAHYRRLQEFADSLGSRSNISREIWSKVLEFEGSQGRSGV